ncbi:hypothetical protein A4X13_0g2095 [Tilletia indica]|uniref:Uncharacterized protein n=1 Tax=Tilletia indica TaxID=43049 RepID=A0A177TWJ7_9BASI|nr:hypothetical protein A4X13_0g2095 [Tilletia indica]
MSEISQYDTYCEIVHSLPVVKIRDNPARSGYVIITTMAKVGCGGTVDAELHGYWRDDRPVEGSIIHGFFLVAATPTGVKMFFEKTELEIRGTSVHDSDYVRTHINQSAMSLRAFGRVKEITATSFTIEVMTYLPTGLTRGSIVMNLPAADRGGFPVQVGNYAGGRGTILFADAQGALVVDLEQLQQGVDSGNDASDGDRSMWMAALTGQGDSSKSGSITEAVREITRTTTFCESMHRFLINTNTDGGDVAVIRGTDGVQHQVPVKVPETLVRVNGGVYGMCLQAGFQSTSMQAASFGACDLRPGYGSGTRYTETQLLKQPIRFRSAGRVVNRSPGEVLIQALILINDAELPVRMRALIPETKRWKNLRPIRTGTFIGLRGTLESIVGGEDCEILIRLEHLCSAPPVGSGSPPQLPTTAVAQASTSSTTLDQQMSTSSGSVRDTVLSAMQQFGSPSSSSASMLSERASSSSTAPSSVPTSEGEESPTMRTSALGLETATVTHPEDAAENNGVANSGRLTRAAAAAMAEDPKGKKRATDEVHEDDVDGDERPVKIRCL